MTGSASGVVSAALEPCCADAAAEALSVLEQLISHDTTVRTATDEARDDARHQEFVADYLRDLGAAVEVIEPDPTEVADHPLALEGQSFEGRPIVWARFPGSGGGRSLLFNGHYDTVPAGPIGEWASDPWAVDVRDGRVHGRGSCDMKGGIAAALASAAAIARGDVTLSGDLLLNVVPFEEINGMGTIATMRRGYRADAAVCCEPTELDILVACRGILIGELEVQGRSAHAEMGQPHHREGGGVNAIDKLIDLLVELRRLNGDWQDRADKQHPLLSTPIVLATEVEGGEFASSWSSRARATLNVCYLPNNADADGLGSRVKAEVEGLVRTAASLDSWLGEHPPEVRWSCDFPPAELSTDEPFVATVRAAAMRGMKNPALIGFDTWADHVTLCRSGIPSVCLGPGSIQQAHSVDEYVELAQLEGAARTYVELAALWCGEEG